MDAEAEMGLQSCTAGRVGAPEEVKCLGLPVELAAQRVH